MIGYILLVLATLSGSAKGFAGKKSSGALETLPHKLYFGMVRTAMCAALGVVIRLIEGDFGEIGMRSVAVAVISGISMSVFLLSWIAAVRGGAYVRLDVCCQTGMVIPCIFAAPLLGERASPLQYAMLCVLVFAIILLSDRGVKGGKMRIGDIFLLFAVWLSSGVNGLTVKLYANLGESSNTFYNLVTFAVAAVAFSVSYLIFRKRDEKVTLPKNHYTLYIPIMAVCLYLNIFLQTAAAKYLDAMIMFPLQTVLGLLISAFMAAVFFGEKPTAKNIVGMLLAAVAIVLMK